MAAKDVLLGLFQGQDVMANYALAIGPLIMGRIESVVAIAETWARSLHLALSYALLGGIYSS